MMPWKRLFDAGWRIVGMNHYRLNGVPHLFCSMAKSGLCITAEGTDEAQVFRDLEKAAGIPSPIVHQEWCAAEQDIRDGFDHIRNCDCGAQ